MTGAINTTKTDVQVFVEFLLEWYEYMYMGYGSKPKIYNKILLECHYFTYYLKFSK